MAKNDLRNVKQTQFDRGQVLKGSFSELNSALRAVPTNAILKDVYTHFVNVVDGSDRTTEITYYQAITPAIDELTTGADVAGSLAGKYIILQEYVTKKTHGFYFVVSGSGTAPGVADSETAVAISTDDAATVVCFALKAAIEVLEGFTVAAKSVLSTTLTLTYFQFGDTSAIDTGTTGFFENRIQEGDSREVGHAEFSYTGTGQIIYQGNTLKGLTFNPYSGSLVLSTQAGTINVDIQDGIDEEDNKKAEMLEAADLAKAFTYTTIKGTDYISQIVFTSAKLNTFYAQTITLTRAITYIGTTTNINNVIDTLTAV